MSVGTITGHAYPANGGRLLFVASDGDLFAIGETGSTISVYRSTDGGATWGSAVTTTAGTNAIAAISAVAFGTDLIAVAWASDVYIPLHGFNSRDVEYQEFNMATNVWSGSVDAVGTFEIGVATSLTDWIGIAARTSDRVIVHPGAHTDMGSRHRSAFVAFGTSGSWTTNTRLDTVNGNASVFGVTVIGSQADEAHLVWNDLTDDIVEGRTLDASNVLSTKVSLDATAPAPDLVMRGQSIASWDDAGTQRIAISQGSTSTDGSVIRAGEDGGNDLVQDDTDFTDITDGTGSDPQIPALAIDIDNDELYAFFSSTDSDLFRDQSTNGASGDWTTDIEAEDAVTATSILVDVIWFTHSSGNGGDTVLGYIFDDAGTTKYGEVVLVAGGGQIIAVGTLAEADVLVTITPVKPIIVGVGTLAETDSLISIQPRKLAAIGVLAEVDDLVSIQARKLADIGVLGENDSLIPVVPVKPIIEAVGVLGETDTPNPIQATKIAVIGTLAEVNNLLSIAAIKVAQIGTVGETDTLITIAVVQPGGQDIAVGTIAEVDGLVSIAALKIANIGTLAESDLLIPIVPVKLIIEGVGTLAESDVLRPITIRKTAPIGTLGELDGLVSIRVVKTAAIGTLGEVDALIPVVPVKPIVEGVGTVVESDLLVPIQPEKIATIGTVAETDALIGINIDKTATIGTLAEVDTLLAIAVIIVGLGWWKKIPTGVTGNPTGVTRNPTGFTKIKSTDQSPWT